MMKRGIIIILGIIIFATGAAYIVNAAGVVFFGGNLHRDVNDGLVLDITLASDNYASSTKTFTDNSRGANHCISTNSAVFTVDNYGKSTGATVFNGTTDVITRSTLNLGSAATFSGWGKASVLNAGMLWNHLSNSYGSYFDLWFGGNQILMNTGDSYNNPFKYDNGTNIPQSAISLNVWHHYVVVLDPIANKSLLYVDGTYWGSAVYKNPTSNTSRLFSIGGAAGYRWNGAISNLKIHNRALSASEVTRLYNSAKPKMQGASLNRGLIGYWPLNGDNYNSTTGRVTDKTPYENHGVNYGATLTTDRTGQSNGAMSFNGVDSRISISYVNPVNQTSVVAWFKRSGSPAGGYHIITGGPSVEISINDPSGYIRTGVNTNTQGRKVFNSGSGLLDGRWHQVALTYDGTNLKSFIDGAVTATNPVSGNLTGTAQEIGRYLSNSYVANGSISDVQIYNRALSEDEIKTLYGSNKLKIASDSLQKGLVLDMPLTSDWVKSDTAGSQIMTDRTPYSHDGQNYGGVVSSEGTLLSNLGNRVATSFTAPNDEGTISIWYKPTYSSTDANRNSVLYSTGAAWVNNSFEFALRACCGNPYDNVLYMTSSNGSNLSFEWNTPVWSADEWINLTVVYKSRNYIEPYINGVLADHAGGVNNADFVFPNVFNIGAKAAGQYTAKGTVASLKVYNRPLSVAEVKLLYEKGRK